jgi:hypothetical protein
VEIGTGPCRVKIYTVNRKDGYPMYSLYWKEGGQRKFRHLACQEEARLIAHQITVRLANGCDTSNEATKRNLEMLRHCENLATGFGVSLTAAMDEWVSARRTAGEIPIADVVRFYAANRADLIAIRTTAQVADEFIASRQSSGVSDAYVRSARQNLKKFTHRVKGNVTDIAVVREVVQALGHRVGLITKQPHRLGDIADAGVGGVRRFARQDQLVGQRANRRAYGDHRGPLGDRFHGPAHRRPPPLDAPEDMPAIEFFSPCVSDLAVFKADWNPAVLSVGSAVSLAIWPRVACQSKPDFGESLRRI